MIEILKYGNTKKKIQCPNCNCIFTYTKNDIFIPRHENLPAVVICPECSYNIDPIFSIDLEEEE